MLTVCQSMSSATSREVRGTDQSLSGLRTSSPGPSGQIRATPAGCSRGQGPQVRKPGLVSLLGPLLAAAFPSPSFIEVHIIPVDLTDILKVANCKCLNSYLLFGV